MDTYIRMGLREIRRAKGLTQEQLEEKSGVPQPTISALETAESPSPSWETVGRLARALEVEPEDICPLPAQQGVA